MSSDNHNEKFKLLGVSGSDSGSEIPEFVLPKRKVKTKKKHRPNGLARQNPMLQRRYCSLIFVLKILAILSLVVTLGVTVWLSVNLHLKVDKLRNDYKQVEESGKSMPSEFHGIHSQLNELQKNHSTLKEEVDQLNRTLESISKEISALKKTSAEIQKSVADAPQLESLPKEFNSLSQNLASIGSKITDLETNLQKNLDVVKSQLANNDKDKLHWEEMLADLQKKVDHVSVSQGKGMESTEVYTYIDSEIKKLDESLFETNVSIWDKLNWATDDLHEHHMTIEATKLSAQNLNDRVSKLESASPINASSDNQTLLKVNETVAAALNSFLPTSLQSLNLMSNGTVVLANLVDYVRNLTRIYVALLAHMKAYPEASIMQLNDTLGTMDLQNMIHGAVDGTLSQQNTKIKELYLALETLNGTIEQMKSVKLPAPSAAEVSTNKPAPESPNVNGNPVEEPAAALATVKPSVTDSFKLNTTAAEAQQQQQQTPSTLENPNGNLTLSPAGNVSVVTAPTNATVIHKPSQTGQSLNHPDLRPDSPPPD